MTLDSDRSGSHCIWTQPDWSLTFVYFTCTILTEQVTWLVLTEVRSKSFGLVREHRHYIGVLCAVSPIFVYWVSLTVTHVIFFSPSMASHNLSVLCMYSKFRHHPHPLGYLCAKFCFFCSRHCWASPQNKDRILNQSLTHSPSLSDAPGTEVFAVENQYYYHWCYALVFFFAYTNVTAQQQVTNCSWKLDNNSKSDVYVHFCTFAATSRHRHTDKCHWIQYLLLQHTNVHNRTQKRNRKTALANNATYTLVTYTFYDLHLGNGVGPIPGFIQQLKQKIQGLSRTVIMIFQAPKSTACNT